MSYINTQTLQYPISIQEIAALNPDTVPTPLDGYAWVFPTPQPTYDNITQSVQEIAPALTVKDTWEQQWQVNELTPEQIAANIEAQRIAAIPASVSRRQGRLALLQAGLLDDVEAAIAAIPDIKERQAAQIEYEADTYTRDNAFLQAMWVKLGGDERGLDDLFTLAGSL